MSCALWRQHLDMEQTLSCPLTSLQGSSDRPRVTHGTRAWFQTFSLWGEEVTAKAKVQLAGGNAGRVLRTECVAGDTGLEAGADLQ